MLDISSLEKGLKQLEASLRYYRSEQAQHDPDLRAQFRNSVVQCFEFTYELSFRTIRRYIKEASQHPAEVDQLEFSDLMREAAQKGLLVDPRRFRLYRERRNLTSHAYDESKAEEVVSCMDGFVDDVRFLIKQLKKRGMGHD